MRYTRENILNSERAYQVLIEISKKDEGSYSTEIAEDLDIDRTMVSEIISNLVEMNILSKGKRTKAQYYEIRFEGFAELFGDLLEDEIYGDKEDQERESIEDLLKQKAEMYEEIEDYDIAEALDRDLFAFLMIYADDYLTRVKDSTIKKMLIDDFFLGIESMEKDAEGIPAWLEFLKEIGRERLSLMENPASIVHQALIEYRELPDKIEDLNDSEE
ncbi:hypothetical protein [Candidatus Nanohalococcus occultus]|uniref:hypothetical protein n=1 Tax=Candidatus Nanohalococcus occultus TaxID=2978047 RepID=UPI0039E0C593